MIEETILGSEMTADEATLAAGVPLDRLPLSPAFRAALLAKGLKTAADLARSTLYLGPGRQRRARRALRSALIASCAPERLENASLAELPGLVREALGHLEPSSRSTVEKLYGLDGRPLRLLRKKVRAVADLRRLLEPDSEAFRRALRSIYLKILEAREGMAGFREWETPSSPLYEGQAEACRTFAFLCRAAGVRPELLVTVGLDHVCYDSLATKSRHDLILDAAKAALLNRGRPTPLDELARRLRKAGRLDVSPQFLRRCIELSREMGIEQGGAVGLRAWPFFDAQSLHAMAYAALATLRRPAHYEEIARTIDELYPHHAPANRSSLHGILGIRKHEFVLARYGGTYGLAEWGTPAAQSIKDFLIDFLRKKGGKAERRDMLAAAREKGFKPSSASGVLHGYKDLFRHVSPGRWELAV